MIRDLRLSLMIVFLLLSSICIAQENSRDCIEAIINRMEPSSANQYQVADELKEFPAEEAVNVVIRHLRDDAKFQDPKLRSIAYGVLDDLRAENFPEGLAQLLDGLRENGYGANALARLGPNPPAEVIEALGDRVMKGEPNDDEVIRALGAYGSLSLPYFDAVAGIFLRADPSDDVPRFVAAKALVSIGGMERALAVFVAADESAATRKSILNAIAYWGAVSQGTFRAAEDVRKSVRDFVRRNVFTHPDREVRLAGLAALQNSYSLEELVVKDENGDWRLNEEVTEVLRHMAANDPDAELQSKATTALNKDQRPFGEKIERRKAAENR